MATPTRKRPYSVLLDSCKYTVDPTSNEEDMDIASDTLAEMKGDFEVWRDFKHRLQSSSLASNSKIENILDRQLQYTRESIEKMEKLVASCRQRLDLASQKRASVPVFGCPVPSGHGHEDSKRLKRSLSTISLSVPREPLDTAFLRAKIDEKRRASALLPEKNDLSMKDIGRVSTQGNAFCDSRSKPNYMEKKRGSVLRQVNFFSFLKNIMNPSKTSKTDIETVSTHTSELSSSLGSPNMRSQKDDRSDVDDDDDRTQTSQSNSDISHEKNICSKTQRSDLKVLSSSEIKGQHLYIALDDDDDDDDDIEEDDNDDHKDFSVERISDDQHLLKNEPAHDKPVVDDVHQTCNSSESISGTMEQQDDSMHYNSATPSSSSSPSSATRKSVGRRGTKQSNSTKHKSSNPSTDTVIIESETVS